MLRKEILTELEKETAEGRLKYSFTLGELYDIDPETARKIEKEFKMGVDDKLVIIITDWTICGFADWEEMVPLFAEKYEHFDTETLKSYLEVI
jgi:hypothetical protein